VHRKNFLDCFQFDNHLVLNDQVNLVTTIKGQSFVDHWNRDLPFEGQAPQVQFVTKTLLVGGFEEARAETPVNFYGRTNNGTRSWVALFVLGQELICLWQMHLFWITRIEALDAANSFLEGCSGPIWENGGAKQFTTDREWTIITEN
jgi:hypothetical protein